MPYKAHTKKHDVIVSEIISKCYVRKFIPGLNNEASFIEIFALWDTGATHSAISTKTATLLDLVPVKKTSIIHAGGRSIVSIYDIDIILPNNSLMQYVSVIETELYDLDLLIGMDIISQGDFSISNKDKKTTFSSRLPSYKEIDFVAEYDKIKTNA